ncbi:hypothetical protein EVAR_51033_1 [Eumeta japonica]|uniref:Uncharacterized protein n=1 Tax=Eumeta variegata TaxID=151549 RepID=A0A4C1Y768_EUMVA|nr:hypothetical protein EVAR_51033_1 [Eumeta japonica]
MEELELLTSLLQLSTDRGLLTFAVTYAMITSETDGLAFSLTHGASARKIQGLDDRAMYKRQKTIYPIAFVNNSTGSKSPARGNRRTFGNISRVITNQLPANNEDITAPAPRAIAIGNDRDAGTRSCAGSE